MQVGFDFLIEQLLRGNGVLSHVEMIPGSGDSLGKHFKIASIKETSQMPILCDSRHVPWQRQGAVLSACGQVSEYEILGQTPQ